MEKKDVYSIKDLIGHKIVYPVTNKEVEFDIPILEDINNTSKIKARGLVKKLHQLEFGDKVELSFYVSKDNYHISEKTIGYLGGYNIYPEEKGNPPSVKIANHEYIRQFMQGKPQKSYGGPIDQSIRIYPLYKVKDIRRLK